MLRWLVIGVLGLSALWAGWWFVGSAQVKKSVANNVEEAALFGWQIDYEDLSVIGFPNRFDTTVTEPRVTPPDGAWTWRAPFLQAFALSYRPTHVIVVAPPEQSLDTRLGPVAITSADLRASIIVTPGFYLDLDRATVQTTALTAELDGQRVSLAEGLAAAQRIDGDDRFDLALTLTDLSIPEAWLVQLPALQAEAMQVRFIGQGTFDRLVDQLDQPLDPSQDQPPGSALRLRSLDIQDLTLRWGAVEASLSGSLTTDEAGRANGTVTVAIADLAATMGVLDGLVSPDRLALAGRFLSGFSTDEAPQGAQVELVLRDGLVLLGPLPLLVLPPLSPPAPLP